MALPPVTRVWLTAAVGSGLVFRMGYNIAAMVAILWERVLFEDAVVHGMAKRVRTAKGGVAAGSGRDVFWGVVIGRPRASPCSCAAQRRACQHSTPTATATTPSHLPHTTPARSCGTWSCGACRSTLASLAGPPSAGSST